MVDRLKRKRIVRRKGAKDEPQPQRPADQPAKENATPSEAERQELIEQARQRNADLREEVAESLEKLERYTES
jgi:hypothetical protein